MKASSTYTLSCVFTSQGRLTSSVICRQSSSKTYAEKLIFCKDVVVILSSFLLFFFEDFT